MPLFSIRIFVCLMLLGAASHALAQAPREVTVKHPTRLDWEFPAKGFGAAAGKLAGSFKSEKQKYQFFAPSKTDPKRPMPLIVFIPAGADPAGWNVLKSLCEKEGILFASPHGAGNSTPASQRSRIILDVLDDIRRNYTIDADQTYLTGFSGGGRMACSLAFCLPEYFGGVFPICGTNPLPNVTYLRHRVRDRLSAAFLTGEKDFNRKENELYMQPWFEELGIRTKVWVAANLGHSLPPEKLLAEAYAWMKDDLPRRQADRKSWPGLNVEPTESPSAKEQGQRLLSTATKAFENPQEIWRGVTLLQGVTQRFDKTEANPAARDLLKKVTQNEALLNAIDQQGAADEVLSLSAQAKALERFGQPTKAVEAWELLARNYDGTPIGDAARKEIRRLRGK